MTLNEFFQTFKHQGNQIEDLMVYFDVYKNNKSIYCGYSVDFGFVTAGSFNATEIIVNYLDNEIKNIFAESDYDNQVCFTIELN